jgi:ATP-dependent Lon protease
MTLVFNLNPYKKNAMRIFKKDPPPEPEAPSEITRWKDAVNRAQMPEAVQKIALKEIDRMGQIGPSSAEYAISLNYLDYLLGMPWNRKTEDNLDIGRAEKILNEAHYGLREIKERILEHLAVRTLRLSRNHRILVVDDEKMTRKNLEHVFTKDGYLVDTAADGAEALEMICRENYDVIVTDLKMEKVDGMKVLEKAKEKDPSIAVIVITGYASVTTAIDAIKKGSHHFIAKPLRLDEIRSVIQSALGKKKLQLEPKGPTLCFVGPPGTGKTSLGLSIARSLERKFIRMSLAGVKDEADIRGHRRSYVGALPGRIIQEVKRVESRNPVFMLDEIDKIGQEYKGDPSAALLELLDPEQNAHFHDHYLDVPFDLSRVMFIATANTTDAIPGPLLDRLEIIRLTGYWEEEKEKIAFNYLIPKEIEEAGLKDRPISFTPDAVRTLIREYTREAGLRELQRKIAAVCRKTARRRLQGEDADVRGEVSTETISALLGPREYHFETADTADRVGVSTGLAWTPVGGQLIFIETQRMPGTSQLILTGSLGDVMRESARAALSFIRSQASVFGISDELFDRHDIHVHVPAGAIPKDGPSAGLAIATAIISLLTGRPCRRDTAMTGELTLSGRILPVGGIPEKILAARSAGVNTVIMPRQNMDDLADLPDAVKEDIALIPADNLPELLDKVLR